jgi:hypothetical protein
VSCGFLENKCAVRQDDHLARPAFASGNKIAPKMNDIACNVIASSQGVSKKTIGHRRLSRQSSGANF